MREIGNYVVMDLGNEYTATCGQLKEVCAAEGEYLKRDRPWATCQSLQNIIPWKASMYSLS